MWAASRIYRQVLYYNNKINSHSSVDMARSKIHFLRKQERQALTCSQRQVHTKRAQKRQRTAAVVQWSSRHSAHKNKYHRPQSPWICRECHLTFNASRADSRSLGCRAPKTQRAPRDDIKNRNHCALFFCVSGGMPPPPHFSISFHQRRRDLHLCEWVRNEKQVAYQRRVCNIHSHSKRRRVSWAAVILHGTRRSTRLHNYVESQRLHVLKEKCAPVMKIHRLNFCKCTQWVRWQKSVCNQFHPAPSLAAFSANFLLSGSVKWNLRMYVLILAISSEWVGGFCLVLDWINVISHQMKVTENIELAPTHTDDESSTNVWEIT